MNKCYFVIEESDTIYELTATTLRKCQLRDYQCGSIVTLEEAATIISNKAGCLLKPHTLELALELYPKLIYSKFGIFLVDNNLKDFQFSSSWRF